MCGCSYINDQPFTDEFRQKTSALTSAPCLYGEVPREQWSYPPNVNVTLVEERRSEARHRMPYGGSESYRFMCR